MVTNVAKREWHCQRCFCLAHLLQALQEPSCSSYDIMPPIATLQSVDRRTCWAILTRFITYTTKKEAFRKSDCINSVKCLCKKQMFVFNISLFLIPYLFFVDSAYSWNHRTRSCHAVHTNRIYVGISLRYSWLVAFALSVVFCGFV
jgi:hypothetical protein